MRTPRIGKGWTCFACTGCAGCGPVLIGWIGALTGVNIIG